MRMPFLAAILLAFALMLGFSACAPRQSAVAPPAVPATRTPPAPVAGRPGQADLSKDPLAMLTPEERQQVQAKMAEMEAKGEVPQAASSVPGNLAAEPAAPAPPPHRIAANSAHAWDHLTSQQQQQVKMTVQMMIEQGSKPEEIQAVVAAMVRPWLASTAASRPRGAASPIPAKSPVTSPLREQTPPPVKTVAPPASKNQLRPTLTQTSPAATPQPQP